MAGSAPGARRGDDTSLYVEVALDAEGETAVLSVHGEVDAFTAPLLDKIVTAVIDHGAVRLVIDGSGVEFMDAAGLRVVVSTANRLRPDGAVLVIRAPSAPVIRLLEMSGVVTVVGIDPRCRARRPATTRRR